MRSVYLDCVGCGDVRSSIGTQKMQQLSIGFGPAGTLLVAGNTDDPRPTVIQNVDTTNILYLGKEVSVNPAVPFECAPLYPGQTTIADGSVNIFGIADRNKNVAINVYEGMMSFFQPVNLNNRTLLGGYFISGSGGGSTWQTAQPSTPGFYLYNDTGVGNPQLLLSISGNPGTDQWGNTWQGGETLVGIPGVTNVFSIVDSTSGANLASIDNSGNINGTTIAASNDLQVGGLSVPNDLINPLPTGVMNRGFAPGNLSGLPWPSTAIGTSETSLMELDATIPAGRWAIIQVLPSAFIPTVSANSQAVFRLRYTNDGTTPTTASNSVAGHTPNIVPISSALTGLNFESPFIEWIPPTPLVDTVYKMLLTAFIQGAGSSFKFQNLLEMRWTDLGVDNGQTGNNAIILGTGTGGGSGGQQTYTENFWASNTWCYESNWGIQNTNGDMYQGAYQGEPAGGYKYSYIQWSLGSRGNQVNTVLNYAQVNWVKLTLANTHSWYNSGMTIGIHASTILGGAQGVYTSLLAQFNISEGVKRTFSLVPSAWAPFKAGGTTYMVLSPDSADLTNLQWYGIFTGGNTSGNRPLLQVNYTHLSVIHFSFKTETVKGWLLNAVLAGYFMVEIAIVVYVGYLIFHHVPK